MSRTSRISAALLVLTLAGGAVQPQAAAEALPAVEREFRGLWVATVDTADGVDWPSKRTLTTREQKAELTAILDRAVELHLNVIVFQVRGNCDAMYDSKIEPWSEYLTGQMGRAPQPYYDPLAFAVEEAHKRGLELHAWFNPYRVHSRNFKMPVSSNHVSVTHFGLVRTYGKFLWLDPTEPGTRDYSLSVIMDVVRRYDIDGVHFDDHFYPDPEKEGGRELQFPDEASWWRYQKTGGKMSRNDWRRENVNMLVRAVSEGIKREKPWVKFGISPFGIWRPNQPRGITGLDAYDKLCGDARTWLAEGWVDYLAPQLYWPAADKPHAFAALLKWWAGQNTRHRLLLAGMRVGGWAGIIDEARETTNEIALTRRQAGTSGEILWHSTLLLTHRSGVAEALRKGVYAEPALVPACAWLGSGVPARPVLTARQNGRDITLKWKEDPGRAWQWVVRRKTGSRWTTEILPGTRTEEVVPAEAGIRDIIAISAVDRYGNMSEAAMFHTDLLDK
ncbi:MAG: glycoside hydrolase family 10 protein [Limisphaerales bacterium]